MKMESKTQRYYREHKRCPACRNETVRQSYVGFIEDGDDIFKPYKDTNKVSCKCGWNGIVHDLVQDKKRNELTDILDKLENDCTLIDGDSGEEYLDIPVERWKELRTFIDRNIQEN